MTTVFANANIVYRRYDFWKKTEKTKRRDIFCQELRRARKLGLTSDSLHALGFQHQIVCKVAYVDVYGVVAHGIQA